MLDLADKQDLRPLAALVRDLRDAAPGADCLLVGAMARDVLLTHAHGISLLRATADVDIALAVADWASFQSMRNALLASEKFVARTTVLHKLVYVDLDIPIDLIPFAGVEDAGGNIVWPPENVEVMHVIGYREARASATTLRLPMQQELNVVSLPMLAVLKVFAWIERHLSAPRKDARDLAAVLLHYLDAGNEDRLYAQDAHLLDNPDYDFNLAGAWMCGRDARSALDTHSTRATQIVVQMNAMLIREADPEGPLRYVGEVQSGNAEQTRKLLAAFAAGLNLKPIP